MDSQLEQKHRDVTKRVQSLLRCTPEEAEELWAEEDHSRPAPYIIARCLARAGYRPEDTSSPNGQEPPPNGQNPPQVEESPPPEAKKPPKDHAAGADTDPKKEQAKESQMPPHEVHEQFSDLNQPPKLDPDAYYGVIGRLTRTIEPHTEADPVAILVQSLIAFGCSIGHGPFFKTGETNHHTNMDACLVGRTSQGRKGSALDYVKAVMRAVDSVWVKKHCVSGLSSGEGLIYAVRDQLVKKEQVKKGGKITGDTQECIVDFGVDDKRLFVTETEFSRPLKAMSRESNILSEIIRQAWDHGDLQTIVKSNPYRATGAHISIVGHITREELEKSLLECNFFNGFANRFLWLCVQRSKALPRGGSLSGSDLDADVKILKEAVEWSRNVGEMERDEEAEQLWESVYGELTADTPGKFGAAVARGNGQVLRLSMNYALSDKSQTIRAVHLRAALALWKYCVDSARYLFLGDFGNPDAKKIYAALRSHPAGMTRTEISINTFNRHLTKVKLDEALSYLRRINLARSSIEPTEGRSVERWFANIRKVENEEYY
jgi:hypothetical protein